MFLTDGTDDLSGLNNIIDDGENKQVNLIKSIAVTLLSPTNQKKESYSNNKEKKGKKGRVCKVGTTYLINVVSLSKYFL